MLHSNAISLASQKGQVFWGETILHLLLKEPKARVFKESIQKQPSPTAKVGQLQEAYIDFKEKRRQRRLAVRQKYEECLDVLLNTDTLSQFHEEQIK